MPFLLERIRISNIQSVKETDTEKKYDFEAIYVYKLSQGTSTVRASSGEKATVSCIRVSSFDSIAMSLCLRRS